MQAQHVILKNKTDLLEKKQRQNTDKAAKTVQPGGLPGTQRRYNESANLTCGTDTNDAQKKCAGEQTEYMRVTVEVETPEQSGDLDHVGVDMQADWKNPEEP